MAAAAGCARWAWGQGVLPPVSPRGDHRRVHHGRRQQRHTSVQQSPATPARSESGAAPAGSPPPFHSAPGQDRSHRPGRLGSGSRGEGEGQDARRPQGHSPRGRDALLRLHPPREGHSIGCRAQEGIGTVPETPTLREAVQVGSPGAHHALEGHRHERKHPSSHPVASRLTCGGYHVGDGLQRYMAGLFRWNAMQVAWKAACSGAKSEASAHGGVSGCFARTWHSVECGTSAPLSASPRVAPRACVVYYTLQFHTRVPSVHSVLIAASAKRSIDRRIERAVVRSMKVA